MQIAAAYVEPTGEERADMRNALSIARLLAMQMAEKPDPEQFREMIEVGQFYLQGNKPEERVLTPAQARAAVGG